MMHTYRTFGEGSWAVGFYSIGFHPNGLPTSHWHPIKAFTIEKEAAAYANYLNGGNGHNHPCFP